MELSIKKISISIRGMKTKDYNKEDSSYELSTILDVDNKRDIISKRYVYGGKSEDILSDLMRMIKDKFAKGDLDYNPLKHNVIIIENLEEVEDKMIAFVKKVSDKIKDFKIYKSQMSYFEMHNLMDTLSVNF